MTDVDKLSNRRVLIVTAMGLTFLFFQIISLQFVADWMGWNEDILNRLEDIGLLAFIVALAGLVWMARKIERGGSLGKAQFYDEHVKKNMREAMVAGFKTLFRIGALIFIHCQFITIDGEDVARIMMTLGFVVPSLRFAFLEAQNA